MPVFLLSISIYLRVAAGKRWSSALWWPQKVQTPLGPRAFGSTDCVEAQSSSTTVTISVCFSSFAPGWFEDHAGLMTAPHIDPCGPATWVDINWPQQNATLQDSELLCLLLLLAIELGCLWHEGMGVMGGGEGYGGVQKEESTEAGEAGGPRRSLAFITMAVRALSSTAQARTAAVLGSSSHQAI